MGVPEFNKITRIQANVSISSKVLDLGFSDAVAAGVTKDIFVYAPSNTLSMIHGFYMVLSAIAGSTGNHNVFFRSGGISIVPLMYFECPGTTSIFYEYGEWVGDGDAGATAYPVDKSNQLNVIKNVPFDDTNYLKISYENGTNLENNGSQSIRLIVTEQKVGD